MSKIDVNSTQHKNKKFRVSFSVSQSGTYDIEARSEEEAKSKLWDIISESDVPEGADIRDREWFTNTTYELKD